MKRSGQFQRCFRRSILLIGFAIFGSLFFQNCGKLASAELDSQGFCEDFNKNLFIHDPNRNIDIGWASGQNAQLQIFEEVDGLVTPFVPQDLKTEWPPRWYKNKEELPPATARLFSTVEDLTCEGDLFEAKFNTCGRERSVRKRLFTGACVPRQCELNGVSANIDEERRFFLSNTMACSQNCQSILRRCVLNSISGAPEFAGDSNYSSPTCTQSQACSTTTIPVTTTTVPTTSLPAPAQCAPKWPTQVVAYGAMGAWRQWPSFNARLGLNPVAAQGQTIAIQFTVPSNPTGNYGNFQRIENVQYGFNGALLMSISETPGCVDADKLGPNCLSIGSQASLPWRIGSSGPFHCRLEPNKTYFLNLTFGSATSTSNYWNPPEPYCDLESWCGGEFENRQQ